jgi:hypothetical protein
VFALLCVVIGVAAGALVGMQRPVSLPIAPLMTVREVHGEVMKIDGSGPSPAAAGTVVEVGDRVATGPEGRAVITHGDDAPIRLAPSTAVRVVAADDARLELELERGQVKARVRAESATLRVSNESRAVSARRGAFAVRVDERGLFSAEAEEGTVAVEGVAGVQELAAGERVVAWPDGRAARGGIPAEPLLDVAWPGATTQSQVALIGTAEPGSRVRVLAPVATPPVEVGPDGRFELLVALTEGKNQLQLEVVDASGRIRAASGTVTRDSSGPSFKIKLEYQR